MLTWFAETTVVAMILALIAMLAGRSLRLGPVARHMLWLVVLVKLLTPPLVNWPWSPPKLWTYAEPPAITSPIVEDEELAAGQEGDTDIDEAQTQSAITPPAPRIEIDFAAIQQSMFGLWCGISAVMALWQIGRIVRFRRRLCWAMPAPKWLVEEVCILAQQIGVRAPEILVLPDLAPPMLWFLGRTKLLLPGGMVTKADLVGLRGILAHELAHIRRGDHWIRRLDFVAGLIWWWNPLYWLTRDRLHTEAELACDEWAIRAVPNGRVSYAEALLDVCRTLSTTQPPAPALGVAAAGRFLERRVTMILHNHAPSRMSAPVLLGAGLLALLALPGWNAAGSAIQKSNDTATSAASDDAVIVASTLDDIANAAVADDDDDKAEKKSKKKKESSAETRKKKGDKKEDADDDDDDDDKDAKAIKDKIVKELKELAPDLEKELKNLGEQLKSELGSGSDFQKEMKKLGEELKKELGPGSDFEKEMKNVGEEMKKKYGPGSDFEKRMKEKGKEIEARFGPGSDFEERWKKKGKEIEARFGSGSDFEQKLKRLAEEGKVDEATSAMKQMMKAMSGADAKADKIDKKSSDTSSEKKSKSKAGKKAKTSNAKARQQTKARMIKALEDQIEALSAQIKKLEEADDDEEEDDD